ncbi:MAG: hypothetical protein M1840_006613 [Geoglossum simile]|nr:MAG: hypothetical protein M1840_006613 [Geoglossum simile]
MPEQHYASLATPDSRRSGCWMPGYLITAAATGAYVHVLNTYLPIWFQSIKDTTALRSGVITLPFILVTAVVCVLVGNLSGKTITAGSARLSHLVSTILPIVGPFLLATLRLSSSQGKWIGFQFLSAYFTGYGVLTPSTILRIYPIGAGFDAAYTAISFAEGIGGAIGIAAAQSVFLNTLKLGLQRTGVSPSIAFTNGATTLKHAIRQQATENPEGALGVYDTALTNVFYISAGSACLALLSLTLLLTVAGNRKVGKAFSSFLRLPLAAKPTPTSEVVTYTRSEPGGTSMTLSIPMATAAQRPESLELTAASIGTGELPARDGSNTRQPRKLPSLLAQRLWRRFPGPGD